jgi:hypothetical protein
MNKVQVSNKLDDAVNESLAIIYKKHKKTVIKKFVIGISSIAAIFTIVILFGKANPALASNWPIIGHIFEQVETDIGYKGNYSMSSKPLINDIPATDSSEENTECSTANNAFVQTSNGITMTISEVYYNSKALYLAVCIENANEFPADFNKVANDADYILDYDRLELVSQGELGFCNQYVSPYYIEGKFKDMKTFIGIIRVDISHLTYWPTDEELIASGFDPSELSSDEKYLAKLRKVFPDAGSSIEVPDSFTYNICFTKIKSDLFITIPTPYMDAEGETIISSEATQKEYKGEWNFNLDVTLDTSKTQTVALNTTNEEGLGLEKVEKTPYEITANEIIPAGHNKSDYFLVVCDANGDLLDHQGEYADSYQVYGRDTSKVYVFLCDYIKYMDELKGYYWSDDYAIKKETKTFAEYLMENSLYYSEVNFSK